MQKFVALCVGAGTALALTACGGGNSNAVEATSSASASAYPSSGVYAPVIKVRGSTASPVLSLSLVHPQDPSVEYVIEDGSKPISDTMTLFSGEVVAGAGRVEKVAPQILLYIVQGTVMAVPLVANGSAPSSSVRGAAAFVTTACKFLSEPNANNYTNPSSTKIGVTTAGPDKICGTSDDGSDPYVYDSVNNHVRLAGAGSAGNFVRDPKSYDPEYQIYPGGIYVVSQNMAYSILAKGLNFRRVVASSPGMAIVELGSSEADSRLVALDVVKRNYVELGPVATGSNWQVIGYDESAYYLYRNSGTTPALSWSVIKIAKSRLAGAQIASGFGVVSNAAMGKGLMYLTVLQSSLNKLYSIDKREPNALVQLDSTPLNVQTTVLASAGTVHLFWRTTVSGSAPSYRIDMVDESNTIKASIENALPLSFVEASSLDFSRSENRTKFILARDVSSMDFSGASIASFDTAGASWSPVVLGKLPQASTLGGISVFAHVSAPLNSFVAGQAIASSNGSFSSASTKTFSFRVDTENSLVFASIVR